jgi:hypothetical protein
MFRTELVTARRHARIWSGGVLLVGALVLYVFAPVSPGVIIGTTWLTAMAAYGTARRFAPAVAPHTLAAASVVVPTLGMLALLPLTIHFGFFAAAGDTRGFEFWVWLSAAFTAITTITTGILIGLRGNRLANGIPLSRTLRPWGIYLIGVGAGCIPGIVFIVPTLLIAVTGLAIVPFIHAMETVLIRERAMLTDAEIPDAIATFRAAA